MGPWYDWVMVQFIFEYEDDSDSETDESQQQPPFLDDDEYPSKIFASSKLIEILKYMPLFSPVNLGFVNKIIFFYSSEGKRQMQYQ